MKRKLKKWVAFLGLLAACLLIIGGTVGAAERASPPEFSGGPRLEGQQEDSNLVTNHPGNSAVVDGWFLTRTKAWAKDHGLGLLYGVGVGLAVGLVVAGVAFLAVASAPIWVIIGAAAVAGGIYGLVTGAIKFDIWDCALFSAIGAVSAGIATALPAAGLMGWLGRGAVEGIGGGLAALGSYLLHDPHPTWGGAGQAFALGAATAVAFMGLGALANKFLGGRLAALGAKLRNLLPWGRGAGTAVEGAEAGLAAGGRSEVVGGATGRGSTAVIEDLTLTSGQTLDNEAAVTRMGAPSERAGTVAAADIIETVLVSSRQLKGETMQGARAIAKKLGHAESQGFASAFRDVEITQENAEAIIRDIMNSTVREVKTDTGWDMYNASGQGLRLKFTNGEWVFQGFLEASKATR